MGDLAEVELFGPNREPLGHVTAKLVVEISDHAVSIVGYFSYIAPMHVTVAGGFCWMGKFPTEFRMDPPERLRPDDTLNMRVHVDMAPVDQIVSVHRV